MKHGSFITSRRVNGRVWNGNIYNRLARKSSKPNHPQEIWHWLARPSNVTLSGEGHNNKQCAVQCDAYWQAEACNSKQTPRAIVERCCCTKMPVHILLPTVRKLKFEVMTHPPYSPDLAPSDNHFFGPLKEALRGRRFTSDQEVKEVVHAWLAAQPKTFFSEGIRKLVQRCTKCVEKQADCVEKLCSRKFPTGIAINVQLHFG